METDDALPDVDRTMNDTPTDAGVPAEEGNDLPAGGNQDPLQAEDTPETPEKDTKASKPLIDFGKLRRSKMPLGKGEEKKIRIIHFLGESFRLGILLCVRRAPRRSLEGIFLYRDREMDLERG